MGETDLTIPPAGYTQTQWNGYSLEERRRILGIAEAAVVGATVATILVPVLIAATIILVVWLVQRRKAKQGR